MTQQVNGTAANASSTDIVVSRETTMDSYRRGLEPTDIDKAFKVATAIAATGYCGIKTPEEALTRIMFGRELALTAMQSIRAVYVVNGRPGLDANVMHGLCLNHPTCEYFEPVESTAKVATYRAKRKGRPEVVLSWTIEQAHAAGMFGGRPTPDGKEKTKPKDNWVNYPENMLRARCIANLARMVFPEAINGMHTAEELDGDVEPQPQHVTFETKVIAQTIDRQEELAKDIIAAIGNVKDEVGRKAVRVRLAEAKEKGVLSGAWYEQAATAYNARFLKKGKSASATDAAAAASASTATAPASEPTATQTPPADAGDAWEPEA